MKNPVVIDASLAAMWAVPENYSTQALELANRWAQEETDLIAPCLMLTEVANALYRRVFREEMNLTTAIEALYVIMEFGIEIREETGLHSKAMELAHQLKKPTTYDCHYLALAQIHRCDLWTGDEKFYNSVRKTFPQVKWIGNYPENKSSHP